MMRLSFTLAVTASTITGLCVLAKPRIIAKLSERVSDYIAGRALLPEVDPLVIRAQFGDVPSSDVRAVVGHTHGVSAANRSTGSLQIDLISRMIGRDPFYFQCSASDQRAGRRGSRKWYWDKDMNVSPAPVDLSASDIIAMVDVDQYVDMNNFMCDHFNPTLIYTFQPGSVSRSTGEYSYTFNSRDEVEYRVSGGGCYKHTVWNYAGDSLRFVKRFMGFPYVVSIFQLERKQMDDDHQLILLAPLKKYVGISALLVEWLIQGNVLGRLRVSYGRFTRMYNQTRDGFYVSTGLVDGFSKSTTLVSLDDELASVTRTSKVGLSLPMVKKKMGDDDAGAEILFEFHKLNTLSLVPQVMYHLDKGVRSYQYLMGDYEPDARPSMVSFMDPIVDGAFCPDRSKNNDQRAVEKRIVEQRNVTLVTPHIMKIVEEFWDFVLGEEAGKMRPVDEDYLHDKQNKPNQQRILAEAQYLEGNSVTKSFVKREAYPKVNDPRIVSTKDGADKRDYSLFMYTMSERIKKCEWYAFGKTPREVADRVVEICSLASTITKSDMSRMDGNWSEVARYFERRGMMKGFRSEYASEISELMNRLINCNGVTTNGVFYKTHLSKLSGEAGTSTMNTALNAFIAYSTFRAMRSSVGYYSPLMAWSSLGIYGGDDGFTADIAGTVYIKEAKRAGQKLVAEAIKRGESGVDFLARQYSPEVWFGDNTSCCMFARTLSKFHTTVHMPKEITPHMKLRDKAYALYLSDANTPIIGEFVKKTIELLPFGEFKNICGAWRTSFMQDEQYPNAEGDWMMETFKRELPDFDVDLFRSWIETCDVETIMKAPKFMEKVKMEKKAGDVVVDDDVHSEQKQQELPKITKTPRVFRNKPPNFANLKTKRRVTRPGSASKSLKG